MNKPVLMLALLVLLTTACTSKPILNPNDKYSRVGHEGSERDIELCEKVADEHLKKSQPSRTKRGAAVGAATGAVVGAVVGSTGNTGLLGGALIGGTAGALGGAAHGAFSTPEGARRGLVTYCLRKKGYSVAGWEN